MRVITPHDLQPLAGESLHSSGGEHEGARHLAPDQEAEPVAPVQEAWVLDLLVDAHAVEAERLDQLHLAAKRVVGGRGQMRLRVVALLQHEAQVVWPAVEEETAVGESRTAEPRVAQEVVRRGVLLTFQCELRIYEVWSAGRPKNLIAVHRERPWLERDVAAKLCALQTVRVVAKNDVIQQEADAELARTLGVAVEGDLQAEHTSIQVGGPPDACDIRLGHGFEPDGLPDAGGAVVPDAPGTGLPKLLAARLCEVGRLVLRADDQHLLFLTGSEGRRDVSGEWRVPALVPGDELPVEPDVCRVVYRAEVQQQPPGAVFGLEGECSAIPDNRVELGISDSACLRLRREGDEYGAVVDLGVVDPVLVEPDVRVVVRELPRAAQIYPSLASELWPGVIIIAG